MKRYQKAMYNDHVGVVITYIAQRRPDSKAWEVEKHDRVTTRVSLRYFRTRLGARWFAHKALRGLA